MTPEPVVTPVPCQKKLRVCEPLVVAPVPVVDSENARVDTTDSGGVLPETGSTNWVLPLGIGLALLVLGGITFGLTRKTSI